MKDKLVLKSEAKSNKIRHTITDNTHTITIIDEDDQGYVISGLDVKNMNLRLDRDALKKLAFFYNSRNSSKEFN